jgi:hypothetical protein
MYPSSAVAAATQTQAVVATSSSTHHRPDRLLDGRVVDRAPARRGSAAAWRSDRGDRLRRVIEPLHQAGLRPLGEERALCRLADRNVPSSGADLPPHRRKLRVPRDLPTTPTNGPWPCPFSVLGLSNCWRVAAPFRRFPATQLSTSAHWEPSPSPSDSS